MMGHPIADKLYLPFDLSDLSLCLSKSMSDMESTRIVSCASPAPVSVAYVSPLSHCRRMHGVTKFHLLMHRDVISSILPTRQDYHTKHT